MDRSALVWALKTGSCKMYDFSPILTTLKLVHMGKVRETYELPVKADGHSVSEPLLMVASDRISTHNVVHKSVIPKKGEVLTALTWHWVMLFEKLGISHHVIAIGDEIYKYLPGNKEDYPEDLYLRSMVVQKLDMIPVEFVHRRHLTGSLLSAYMKSEDPYGLRLSPGLQRMHRFENVIFTPTDKSETDDPLRADEVSESYPRATSISRSVFEEIEADLGKQGIALIDTKLELGFDENGMVVVGDEIVTPDSSRFTGLDDVKLGVDPPWLDKQPIRDEAERMWAGGGKVPLVFPNKVIIQAKERYVHVCEIITRMSLRDFQQSHFSS